MARLLVIVAAMTTTFALLGAGVAEAAAASTSRSPLGIPTVSRAPTITQQPASQNVPYGSFVTVSASASGTPTPTVQWQLSVDHGTTWFDVAGLTTPSWTRGPVTFFEQGWEVRAVFTNSAGSATTSPAAFTVTGTPPLPPVITRQPRSRTVAVGHNLTFSASARGVPSPSVQWQLSIDHGADWFDVAGLTTRTWTRGPATFLEQGWQVRAVFTNSAGSATTSPATITVISGPTTKGNSSGLSSGPTGQAPTSGSASNQSGQDAALADQSSATLPFTGFPVEQSIVIATALLAAGLSLIALSRRPLRPRRTTVGALLAGDDPRYP